MSDDSGQATTARFRQPFIAVLVLLKIYLLLISGYALPLMAQGIASPDPVVPATIKFAGSLNDSAGKPLSGTIGVTFLLYKEQSGGAPLWMETQNVQADNSGHYATRLGSTTSRGIPADVFAGGAARWLSVQPSGQAEQPRVELVSGPYALKAADAQTLGGLPPSAFLQVPLGSSATNASTAATSTSQTQPAGTKPVTTTGGTAQSLSKFDSNTDLTNSQVFDTGTNVGIATTTPAAKLDVNGNGMFRGPLTLSITGGTATNGKNSPPLNFTGSAFNSSTSQPVNETFRLQLKTLANNTANPSGKLDFLFGSGAGTPLETGLSISNKGIITFAPGQTFPGGTAGSGTVKSVGLNAPASDFSVTGSPVTNAGTLNLLWLVPPSAASVPNAIVKRDGDGDFAANNIFATQNVTANFVASNLIEATLSAPSAGGSVGAIEGFATASGAAGTTAGIIGESASDSGIGVFGIATGVSGTAVLGEGISVGSEENGVVGVAHGGGSGVFGSNDHPNGIGVLAINGSGGDALFASAGMGGLAAFFDGDVHVSGNLSKSSGSFKIDHPLDPANKYLYHSFVESPDMMNIYNGTVTTDGQGNAVIHMPKWFEALNRDFRYQLTVIGQLAQAFVASEMVNNIFAIQTDKPNVKVSWQVTGIRQDAYANAHRIPVEQSKPEKERGFYLHPELFSAPVEKSIAANRHRGAAGLSQKGMPNLTDSAKP